MSREENRIWKVNNLEFEFDLEDADTLENMMDVFERVDQKVEQLGKVGPHVGYLRSFCDIYYEMFDNLFGEGAGEKIFEGKHNARICEEVSNDFISFANRQVNEVGKRRSQRTNKYVPNRKQRRNNQVKYYNGNKR